MNEIVSTAVRNTVNEKQRAANEKFLTIYSDNEDENGTCTIKTEPMEDKSEHTNGTCKIKTEISEDPSSSQENIPLEFMSLLQNSCNNTNFNSVKNDTVRFSSVKLNQLLETLCGPDMTCLQCQKSFKQRAHLQRHVKEQHFANEPDHVCAICNKAFHQKANLMCHMLTHLKNRTYTHPFKCLLCEENGFERKFTRKSSLRRHVETKHPSCDKDSPWIAAQKKPKIARQLCDNLNTKHLLARHHDRKCFKEKNTVKSPTNTFESTNTPHTPSICTSPPNQQRIPCKNVDTNDIDKDCNKLDLFPEIFLLENPQLLDQLFASATANTLELMQVDNSLESDMLGEAYEDMPPLISQNDVLVKSESDNDKCNQQR
ncbi:hypothetical protein RFI_10980 [Reticulomyxa filosa]|uniref:C2H2-type domain-containing protein n=1 Tax=Reticulomyxa filosa TaxID=46433 RepID=X6NL95_RETFI|nr:hypothetical protein RFI_10980 [Reticulomyxa filosa]|eukprot:ETO26157.1 hypothetical protein RFI_10980 [Reticulomyxa filosa]